MNEQEKIYQVIASIPKGRLCSYGEVAKLAGLPGRARWVGRTLSQLPSDSRLPWFRVISAQGKISFPAHSAAYQRQLALLIAEGSAEPSGKIHWRQYRWPS
ncbi:MGMT family protein [Spongiibacter taiwanensis]|uniref:MGMT family protein n=1 Tax=Spongiibacter taiwanensis TaxID=1748242 RepID=UPI0020350209|nr:MGMT family protein [Spongiibacter taiwanensis]USA44225.1 MGMT family protein [Spongiibacter taiwanensis]